MTVELSMTSLFDIGAVGTWGLMLLVFLIDDLRHGHVTTDTTKDRIMLFLGRVFLILSAVIPVYGVVFGPDLSNTQEFYVSLLWYVSMFVMVVYLIQIRNGMETDGSVLFPEVTDR